MESENVRESLDKYRVDIVQNLDLQRQFIFCYLRSKSVLDEEDCERILAAGAGRQQRVSKFLDVLACKGPEGYKCFVESLEIEHPYLFEKMTGQRATKRPTKNELLDFDREYLAGQLEKTATDLHELTYRHNKMLHEKASLEKKIIETEDSLENEQMKTKDLEEEIMHLSTETLEGSQKSAMDMIPARQYVQELIAENADKSNSIISLQQELLNASAKAQYDKTTIDELQRRYAGLCQQIRDLTINYDLARRNSKKMGEKISRQNDQIRQGDELRREIFELKLKLSEMQEQRDDAKEELREFRNVTEALNEKVDTVRKEKDLAVVIKENFSGTVIDLEEQTRCLQMKLRNLNFAYKDLERKHARQSQEIRTLREEKDILLNEREKAIQERTQVAFERDEALRMNQELQNARDDVIAAQIKINKAAQDNYSALEKDLETLNSTYIELVKEYQMAQDKWEQTEKERMVSSQSNMLASAPMQAQENGCESIDKVDGRKRMSKFPWKSRTNTSILNSAYRRINEKTPQSYTKHSASLPLISSVCDKNTFEKIIGPYRIKDQQNKQIQQEDIITISLDNVEESIATENAAFDYDIKGDGDENEAEQMSDTDNVDALIQATTAGLLSVNSHSKEGCHTTKSEPPSPTSFRKVKEIGAPPSVSELRMFHKSSSWQYNIKQKGGKSKMADEKAATNALIKSSLLGTGFVSTVKPKKKLSTKAVSPKLKYRVATGMNRDDGSLKLPKGNDYRPRRHSTSGIIQDVNAPGGIAFI
eukprot:gene9407-10395_t